MSSRIDTAVNALIGVAALAVAASVGYRTFGAQQPAAPPGAVEAAPRPSDADWKTALQLGRRVMGDSTAPIKLVEFSDLECPACKGFHRMLAEMLPDSVKDVQVILVHYPLTMHRFALPAARAAECAVQEGLFSRFTQTAFALQDSLGLLDWGKLASRAGIVDTARIAACASNPASLPRIHESVALANRMGVSGTPTVFVSGIPVPNHDRAGMDAVLKAARKTIASGQ